MTDDTDSEKDFAILDEILEKIVLTEKNGVRYYNNTSSLYEAMMDIEPCIRTLSFSNRIITCYYLWDILNERNPDISYYNCYYLNTSSLITDNLIEIDDEENNLICLIHTDEMIENGFKYKKHKSPKNNLQQIKNFLVAIEKMEYEDMLIEFPVENDLM